MYTLFVDVDGTLIDANDSINTALVQAIETARRIKAVSAFFIVWSGGGRDYAGLWGRRAFKNIDAERWMPIAKDREVLEWGDIAIDDMLEFKPRNKGVLVVTPEEFIEAYGGD